MHEFAGIAFCLVYIILQNFRMWFKYGLKAQKLLAQGIALGTRQQLAMRPVRAKALYFVWYMKAFALTGRQTCVHDYPGHRPGLGASALSGRKGTGWVVTFIL